MKFLCSRKIFIRSIVSFFACAVLFFSHTASAATLFTEPSSGTYTIGDIVDVSVYINSSDQAMNALSGELDISGGTVQIVSVSTSSSIIPLWIPPAPSFSGNSVTFEGIVLNPGFTGPRGNIMSLRLRVLSEGTVSISFPFAEVLANDGLGTSILISRTGSSFIIKAEEEVIDEPPPPPDEGDDTGDTGEDEGDTGGGTDEGGGTTDEGGSGSTDTGSGSGSGSGSVYVPKAPLIISETHPDQGVWYSDNSVVLRWEKGSDVSMAHISITPEGGTTVKEERDTLKTSESLSLDDGVWDIRIQLKNSVGWGESGLYRIHIDKEDPHVGLWQIAQDGVSTYARSSSADFMVDGHDVPSGMKYFDVSVDGTSFLTLIGEGPHKLHVDKLSLGEHELLVKGFDHAENSVLSRLLFTLTPFDPIGVGENVGRASASSTNLKKAPLPLPLPGIVTPEVVSFVSYTGFSFGLGQVLVLAGNTTSFMDLWLILLRLFTFMMSFFRRRKSEPWGVVYDSVTKQPLDPAYVIIREKEEQKGMAITDLDGRYGFLIGSGEYTIEANKTHYVFPSEKLRGKKRDEFYDKLYFGGPFTVDVEGGLVNYNIPLDPVGFDWNEFAKKQQGLFYVHSGKKRAILFISNFIFFSGFVLSSYILWYQPSILNAFLFSIYAGIVIFQTVWKTSHPITRVMKDMAKEVVPFAVIKACFVGNDFVAKTVVADENGQFYLLTPPGEYYFTVEVKLPDGTYSKKYKTESVKLTEGIVLKNLFVKEEKPKKKPIRLVVQ